MLKSSFRSPPFQFTLGVLVGLYQVLVARTTRWTDVRRDLHDLCAASDVPTIYCFWHARIIGAVRGWRPRRGRQAPLMLISLSPDGEFVARACLTQGIKVVRGSARNERKSKDKGGLEAYRAMLAHLSAGGCVAITPDGPRGPRQRAAEGAVRLARHSGARLLPCGWSVSGAARLNSWDCFMTPPLFGRGAMVWGDPISVPRSAKGEELEKARLDLERALNAVTDEADRMAGMPVLLPAPSDLPQSAQDD